jgi:hypothetical protein
MQTYSIEEDDLGEFHDFETRNPDWRALTTDLNETDCTQA